MESNAADDVSDSDSESSMVCCLLSVELYVTVIRAARKNVKLVASDI